MIRWNDESPLGNQPSEYMEVVLAYIVELL